MATVYIETSVVSYLTARPSASLLAAAHQQVTREWWDHHRHRFEQFISPMVIDEARRGDPEAAARRLAALEDFSVLEPTQAAADLVTRNCRHIDNAEVKPLIRAVCAVHGYVCPEICTPEELMGGRPHEG